MVKQYNFFVFVACYTYSRLFEIDVNNKNPGKKLLETHKNTQKRVDLMHGIGLK